MGICDFAFYESLSPCPLEICVHHFAAPKSVLSIFRTLTSEHVSSARSSLNMCLSRE